jgi:hypothetical protein
VTTYRLFPSTSGPSSPVAYSGNFLAGMVFKVTRGGMWLNGYYHWVPAGGDTVSRKFALWALHAAAAGTLISSATVPSSGTLTAGQWNYVPLAAPVQLAPSTAYVACTGWTAVAGFPDSDTAGNGTGAADSFGAGGHTSGITQGPLFAFSDQATAGTAGEPYGTNQGLFSTAGTDPTVTMPGSGSASGNFWVDVQVSDTGPAGYSGSYRLYPNKYDANSATVADSAVSYVLATEFHLSQACTLNKIWYYSPSGTAQLATSCRIWSVQGVNSGASVAASTSPSWSGAAGSGWVSCSFTGVTLPAGSYKASVYNGAATPDGWGAKDANTNYWGTGDGASGFTTGPLSAPGLSTASLAYQFAGSSPGSTPPYTNGTTEAGQSTFANGTGDVYPYLYVDGLAQNYWLDIEVTPVASATVAQAPLVPPGMMSPAGLSFAPLQLARALLPDPSLAAAATAVNATVAAGTGTAQSPALAIGVSAAVAAGTGSAQSPAAATGVNATAAAGTGAALNATASTTATGTATAVVAAGAGTAQPPAVAVAVNAAAATGAGAAPQPSVTVSGSTNANAGLASGTGTALPPAPAAAARAGLASGTGTALAPGHGAAAGLASGSAAVPAAVLAVAAQAAAAQALAAALGATGASVEPFTVGVLTAATAAQGTLTTATQTTGGPS